MRSQSSSLGSLRWGTRLSLFAAWSNEPGPRGSPWERESSHWASSGSSHRSPACGASMSSRRYVSTRVKPLPTSQSRNSRRGKGRGSIWTDDRIREDLRRFLTGRAEWPTYREFERSGLKGLRDAITHSGGAERWAKELGVRFVKHRPGYATIWTEDRIRRDLRKYLRGRNEWPSRQEFERDGLTSLRNAINRTGGAGRWAAEFRLPRRNRRLGIRRGWTADAIEAQLKQLIGDSTTWPTRGEFERAGLRVMASVINAREGPASWADRLGVQRRPSPPGPERVFWIERRIRRELEEFCAGRAIWRTEREFLAQDKGQLYRAASRAGGIPFWADQLGLPRRRPRP
jgi:hypothetical protein